MSFCGGGAIGGGLQRQHSRRLDLVDSPDPHLPHGLPLSNRASKGRAKLPQTTEKGGLAGPPFCVLNLAVSRGTIT